MVNVGSARRRKVERVLVLNMDYTFLGICQWQSAINAVYTNKAVVEEEYDKEVHSPSITMKVPAVIRLKKWVRVAYERISYVSYTKNNVHRRDNYKCIYCGEKCGKGNTTIDHLLPESKGGKNEWSNTATCCKSCNYLKDDRTPEQARMKLLWIPNKPRGFLMIVRIKLGMIHDLWAPYLKE